MSWALWALPGLPAAVGATLAISGRRGDRRAAPTAIATLAATGGLAVWAIVTGPAVEARWIDDFTFALGVDGLSAIMVGTVVAVALAVLVFASADIEEARSRFFGLMLLFVAAMLGTVTATSLGALLFAWEIMGACSWGLIGFWWYEPDRPACANTAFVVTRGADIGLYLAVGAAAVGAGTFAMSELAGGLSGAWLHLAVAGVVLSAAGKSAQLPFSSWLAAAMQGPTPVSALLHSATMVAAGAYLVFRLWPLLATSGWALDAVRWLGAITALVLGLFAVAQRDLKQLLAASTVAQVGFMFLAAGVAAVPGGTAHLVGHAAYKPLLFMGAGVYLHRLEAREFDELEGRGGGALRGTTSAFAVGALALAALPPLSGWVTKDEILAATREHGLALWLVALAASLVTALYAGRALLAVLPTPRRSPAADGPPPARGFRYPMWLLALGSALFGVVGLPAVRTVWEELVSRPHGPLPEAFELVLSAAIAVAGLAVAWLWWRSGRLVPWRPAAVPAVARRALYWWGYLEQAGFRGLVLPTRRFAAILARFDDRVVDAGLHGAAGVGVVVARSLAARDRSVVDAGVRGTARLAVAVGAWVRWFDHGGVDRLVRAVTAAARGGGWLSRRTDERAVDRLVEGIAATVGRLGSLARRPQTGLLHRYYTQAVSALFVLLVAFLLIGVAR